MNLRSFGSTAVLLSMLGLSSAVSAQLHTGPIHGQNMSGGWWMFFGPMIMILFMAAIVVFVVVAVVLAIRWLGGPGQVTVKPPPGKTPLDILKERLAHGGIDKDEFEERRLALGE